MSIVPSNNFALNKIVNLIVEKNPSITVVGDEDQCIYTWQGAHVENFDELKDNFMKYNPEEMILRTNYRSTEEIVKKSQNLMNAEKDRKKKDLKADEGNGKGVPPELWECETKEDEFSFIKKKISELKGKKIGKRGKRLELEDFVVLFRKNMPMGEFKRFIKNDAVKTSTIHGIKGDERPVVFIAHVENGSIPNWFQEADFIVPVKLQRTKSNIADSIAHDREERRNLYVAMTRAKEHLILTYHTDDKKPKTRSKFLNDIKIKSKKYEK